MARRPTVVEVARHAGVSIASVSRVLNGIAARPETERRVRAAVAELGYVPNGAARNLVTYDDSGRVVRVTADVGPATDYDRVVDITYCYTAGTTPAGGCTTSAAGDRDKLVWQKDNLTGKATTYDYDGAGRLIEAAVTGGGTGIGFRWSTL